MVIRLNPSKGSVFTCLALLSGVAIASGQRVEHKPSPTEPLEKYGDPPAYIWQTGVSPGMISRHDAFTSVQVNVDSNGNNITGDAANEPSICVHPTDGNKMAIGWRQFDTVSSNFRQAGYGYTTNGGASWTFPGVLENNVFRSDPVLGPDDLGNFFYLSLLSTFFDTMWRSLNGGQNWTNIAPATGGDKQWFTIDKTNSTGHGFQYQFWDYATPYGTREFSRSTDGGFTWMDPIDIPHSPQWGTPDVDSNGNLFFGGVTPTLDQFWCLRSTNAKNGAVTPIFDQSTVVNLGGVIDYMDTINPEGLIGQVFLAVDRSGTNTNDNVYMLASVKPTGFTTGSDVMFARSTDSGATFSVPVRVNDDPVNHNKWHWFGTMAVAPNGRIDSVWLDTRNAANNTDSQLFYSSSTDGGKTWSPNVAVSNSFNPFLGYPNQNKLGDYMTIVSDNDGGNVAYAATFNLEQDVYYVRVTPSSQGTQLVSAASRLTHGGAGTFDVPMPLTGTSGVEDRGASTYNAVFNFNATVTSGEVLVVSGTATVGTISFSGNTMTAQLTGVTAAEVVTLRVQNINGDGRQYGDVPFGFLTGDANASRRVDKPDRTEVQGQINQPVTGANFRDDLNVDGRIRNRDVQIVKVNKNHTIP
jgi:hypothetical protein